MNSDSSDVDCESGLISDDEIGMIARPNKIPAKQTGNGNMTQKTPCGQNSKRRRISHGPGEDDDDQFQQQVGYSVTITMNENKTSFLCLCAGEVILRRRFPPFSPKGDNQYF